MSISANELKNEVIINRICHMIHQFLDGRSSALVRLENQTLINGESCTYSMSLSEINKQSLVLDEQILTVAGSRMTHRHWVFFNSEGWTLGNANRNSIALTDETVSLELADLHDRLESIRAGQASRFDIPVTPRETLPSGVSHLLKNKSSRVFTLAAAGLVMAGLFLTIFISTMQYGRMLKTVLTLNDVIATTSENNNGTIQALSSELNRINQELSGLKSDVFQEQEAFEFNKKQTAMNLRWLASRFPRSSSSRARAYEYLADRIDEAGTYGEMVYQMSRLPENNEQAETLMATDRNNRLSMSNFEPAIPGLILPVSSGHADDENVFMISSGFIERRLSPLGYGGIKPHLAVDLINLDNIIRISENNEIIRDSSLPGTIQSVYDGTVMKAGFDWVYGWNAEVRHEITPEVRALFPDALFWTSFYAHMQNINSVEEGLQVRAGDMIGQIGNSGKSTGPHLHFELRVYSSKGSETSPYGNFDRLNPYQRISSEEEGY